MNLSKDIYIYYSGGSGGVLLQMSLLLLLEKTHKNYSQDISNVVNAVWDISDSASWKDSEPMEGFFTGESTVQEIPAEVLTGYKNIFRVCGAPKTLHTSNDISISIYTDIETQFELAKLKNAHWFRPAYHGDGGYESNGVELYNAIKEDDWPEVASIDDLLGVSDHIKNELINERGYPAELNNPNERILTKLEFIETVSYNGYKIHDLAERINKKCDYVFFLQDVLSTKFKCITDALEIPYTIEVQEHVEKWIDLHPESIKRLITSEINVTRG